MLCCGDAWAELGHSDIDGFCQMLVVRRVLMRGHAQCMHFALTSEHCQRTASIKCSHQNHVLLLIQGIPSISPFSTPSQSLQGLLSPSVLKTPAALSCKFLSHRLLVIVVMFNIRQHMTYANAIAFAAPLSSLIPSTSQPTAAETFAPTSLHDHTASTAGYWKYPWTNS